MEHGGLCDICAESVATTTPCDHCESLHMCDECLLICEHCHGNTCIQCTSEECSLVDDEEVDDNDEVDDKDEKEADEDEDPMEME